jgi:vacuolar-type H+-ATPase subunit E/Vma4
MKALGSVGAVLAAVREEAAAEVERLERGGAAEIDRLRAKPAAPPSAPARDERIALARREARERLLRADWEDARAALEAREKWVRAAVALGNRRLAEPEPLDARRALLLRLAKEAISRLPGTSFEIAVSAGDAPLLDEGFRAALGAPEVRVCVAPLAGGCTVRTSDGRLAVDNGFEERARQLESAWRAALGRLYEP